MMILLLLLIQFDHSNNLSCCHWFLLEWLSWQYWIFSSSVSIFTRMMRRKPKKGLRKRDDSREISKAKQSKEI